MKDCLALFAAVALAAASDAAPLRMIPIDVEGGAATLYIAPDGKSLLVDAGWPAGLGGPRPAPGQPPAAPALSSAAKIIATARQAGLSRFDYVLVTHYHVDHVGGLAELAAGFPVGTFLDHGKNREQPPAGANPARLTFAPVTTYPRYIAAIAGHPHRVLHAGDTLHLGEVLVTVVNSDGAALPQLLKGASTPGVGCQGAAPEANDGGEENWRSAGLLLQWGKARVLALGDSTMRVENALVCPANRIGKVDVMLADNHGSDNSNGQALLDSVSPRIVVLDNGATKGADAATFGRIAAMRQPPAVWQLHLATRSPTLNTDEAHIANLSADEDAHLNLQLSVERDGTITILNPRTNASTRYPPGSRTGS